MVTAVIALAVLCAPGTARSQQMNFSYYADAYIGEDNWTLYTVVDGQDFSSGCTHYDYAASGWVSGPTGYFQQNFPGLSTYVNAPLAAGTYAFGSNVTVNCSCFGSGLGAGGGYDTEEVLPIPSGETTSSSHWVSPTGHHFHVTLNGGTFDGRTVRERNGGGDVDTCHYVGSSCQRATGVDGTSAPVENNTYGDTLELSPFCVNHYRQFGPTMPCRAETNQKMQINQTGGKWVTYKTNRLKNGIAFTYVWHERDGVAVSNPY